MPNMVDYSADQLLSMTREELKKLRPTFFKQMRAKGHSKELLEAFLEFISRYTIIQDMRDWSCLAEPGIAALMIDDEDVSEADIEDARELDRNSLEMHTEITEEFDRRGGREAFQQAIDRLNAFF